MKHPDFETLVGELLKDRPDTAKIAQLALGLRIPWDGDVVNLMAEVLKLTSEKPRTKRTPEKPGVGR